MCIGSGSCRLRKAHVGIEGLEGTPELENHRVVGNCLEGNESPLEFASPAGEVRSSGNSNKVKEPGSVSGHERYANPHAHAHRWDDSEVQHRKDGYHAVL